MKNKSCALLLQRRSSFDDLFFQLLDRVRRYHVSPHGSFIDLKEIGERSKLILTDHQSREELGGFEQNSLNGLLLHGVSGWDVQIPQSMANYTKGKYFIRRSANPPLETQSWMLEGIAGGISPWTHFIGAVQEDRRIFDTPAPVMDWHEKNEKYLYNGQPVANVGLVWKQLL